MEANGYELEEALNVYDQGRYINYLQHETLVELAYELVEEGYDLPEFALRYFDYEAFARDLRFDGYTETSYGVIYTE
jgi:antirestriction protein